MIKNDEENDEIEQGKKASFNNDSNNEDESNIGLINKIDQIEWNNNQQKKTKTDYKDNKGTKSNVLVTRQAILNNLITRHKQSDTNNEEIRPHSSGNNQASILVKVNNSNEEVDNSINFDNKKAMEKEYENTYCDSFIEYSRFLLLLTFQLLYIVVEAIGKIILKVLILVGKLFLLLLKLIIVTFLSLYFIISSCFPSCKTSPFKTPHYMDRQEMIEEALKHKRTLYLDLDDTLVHVTNKKPIKGDYIKAKLKSVYGISYEKIYIIKRPYLDTFLREVS